MMKQTIFSFLFLPVTILLFSGCNKEVNEIQPEDFVIFASTGAEYFGTRVSSSYADNQISFVWSEDDSLFVTVFKTGTQFTKETVKELPTYIFKIKSGVGTENAVFYCKDFVPSEVFESGTTYTVFAAYNPYNHYSGTPWDDYQLPSVNTNVIVPSTLYYDTEKNPLQLVDKYDMLFGTNSNVTLDSSVNVSLQHGITIFKMVIHNIGLSDVSLERFYYPSSSVYSSVSTGGRYFGEDQCVVVFNAPLTINPGENRTIYIPAPQMARSEFSMSCCPTPTYTFLLTDGGSISFEKTVSSGFTRGRLYQTTFSIDLGTAFSIPGISGTGRDDF